MPRLSHDQFAGKVNAGGASRLLHSGQEWQGQRGEYAVGTPGHELKYGRDITRDIVSAHRKALLADPTVSSNPDAMQGGWKHAGETFLDASTKVQGRRAAQAAGRKGQQIAVYDAHNDRDVYMKQGPARTKAKELQSETKVPHKVRGSRAVGFTVHPR